MKKGLSIISFITIFVPISMFFVWKPTSPNATAIAAGYSIFILISFLYTLLLFCKVHLRDIYVKVGLAVNAIYLLVILFLVVIPRFI